MKPWLGITWSISNRFGWGIYGLNLVLECLSRGRPVPICLDTIATESLDKDTLIKLQPVIEFQEQNLAQFFRATQVAHMKDAMVLHALGNGMEWGMLSQAVEGDVNVGVIFFEHAESSPEGLARLNKLDGVIAGSSWNAEVLESWNVKNVRTVLQGVDTERFQPRPKTGRYGDRFVVFSGGKLDFRKGQDIVIKAFKEFARKHDDAVLVSAWQNLWPLTALGFGYSPHTEGLPRINAKDRLNIVEWVAANGIAPEQFVDIGLVPNERMPDVLSEVDVAVFPNRCEGGTNLVAMEAMASGIPCILSDNTGHRDLTAAERCYILEEQGETSAPGIQTAGWGESDVDEVIACLEAAYADRAAAREKGRNAAAFMKSLSWTNQIGVLLDTLEELDQLRAEG